MGSRKTRVLMLSAMIMIGVEKSTFYVRNGHRGLLFDKTNGVQNTVYKPGLHFKKPFIDQEIVMDIMTKRFNVETQCITNDMEPVHIELAVLYKPNEEELTDLLSKHGNDYQNHVLSPSVEIILQSIAEQYDALQLVQQRENVNNIIADQLTNKFNECHVQFQDVSINHLRFSDQFTREQEKKWAKQ